MRSNSRAVQPPRLAGILASFAHRLVGDAVFVARLLRWLPIWALLAVTIGLAAAAYQTPRSYTVYVGSPQDQAYTRNFHTRLEESGRAYRWSDVYGYVSFPGIGGSRPFTVTTLLDPGREATVEVFINGERFMRKRLEAGWQTLMFSVDEKRPTALASRDTVVEFRAPDYRSEDAPSEPKGVKVARVMVEQAGVGGPIWPSLSTLVYIAFATLLLYLLVGRTLQNVSRLGGVRWRALAVAAAGAGGLCIWLLVDRMAASAAASHVVITLTSVFVLLALTEWLVSQWERGMGPGHVRLLVLSVAGAFALRYGGMALPQAVIIDMPYHMKWLRILLSGDWQSLYFPGGLSAVPSEWGLSLLIPKSPLFYAAVAPFSILPFDIETLVKWIIAFLDASVVLGIYWFTRRASGNITAALLASGVYALMPLAFRAFAYGILPTIFAQWLATLLLVEVLARSGVRWRVADWTVLLVIAVQALVAFPTVAVFLTLVLTAAPLVWRRQQCSGRAEGLRDFQWRPYALLVVAWAAAVWLYYGLYISPVIASARAMLAPAAGGGATVKWPGGPAQLLGWTADYVVTLLPAILGVVGVALLVAGRFSTGQKRAVALVLIWLAIAPLFVLVNYKVDMIGKHLFFTMAPLAVVAAVALWQMLRRGLWSARLAVLLLVVVGWQALVFWVDRLVRAST